MIEQDYDALLKIILIGPTNGGKSSILKSYVDEEFQENHIPTIGVDFKTKLIEEEGYKLKFQIWDTAGQERFRTITNAYYRGVHVFIIIFDLTDRQQFTSVQVYIEEIDTKGSIRNTNNILVVGNKADLQIQRKSTFEEGMEMATRNNAYYTESSAKEGRSIEIFELAGQLGLEEWLEQRNNLTLPTPQGSAPQMTNRNIALQALTPPQYDYLIKILLIGPEASGKTCLVSRFVNNTFLENYMPTIGIDFKTKTVTQDGKIIKLQCWETSGQHRFISITNAYFKKIASDGYLVVFDITDRNQFERVEEFLIKIRTLALSENIQNTIICGNKLDLIYERKVAFEEGMELANKYGIYYMEISAQNATSVDEAFLKLARFSIVNRYNN